MGLSAVPFSIDRAISTPITDAIISPLKAHAKGKAFPSLLQ